MLIAIWSFSQERTPDEMVFCDPQKGQPFIPLFFISEIGKQSKYPTNEVWKYARLSSDMLNSPGWLEMLKAAVTENDTFYKECKKNKGNYECSRTVIKTRGMRIFINKGQEFNCLPKFEILGTFQNYKVGNFKFDDTVSYSHFLLYKYSELFNRLPDDKKIALLNKFYCNVNLLKDIDNDPPYYIRLRFRLGRGGGEADLGYNTYYYEGKLEITKYLIGHEVGHNAGLYHYFDPLGLADIWRYVVEDFPENYDKDAKFYGRSKDGYNNPGKYGAFYKIDEKVISETLDDNNHIKYDNLKRIVYEIEECAQRNNKEYKAPDPPPSDYFWIERKGGTTSHITEQLPPYTKAEFKKYSNMSNEQCKNNYGCRNFVNRVLDYYKTYLRDRFKDSSLGGSIYEECFIGKEGGLYNYMDYYHYRGGPDSYLIGCGDDCNFSSYQIYQRWRGDGYPRPAEVQEWIYMSIYDRKHEIGDTYYYDLSNSGGAYKLKQQVIQIFKEMAQEVGLNNYAVPIFEEEGENTVDEGFYEWLKNKKDELIRMAQENTNCPAGYPKLSDIIKKSLQDIQYKLTHSKLIK